MHSMLTPILANEVISDHARTARAQRAARRPGRRLRRFGRRGAPSRLVPRGQRFPPFAH